MEVVKDSEEQRIEAVKDSYKIAYLVHFILGAGNLLPWNTFITAIDYFTHLYPEKHVERVFSVAYMSSSVLMLLMLVASRGSRKASFRVRMNVGFMLFVLSLTVAPVVDWAKWWKWSPLGSFTMTVGSVVTCGLADGLIGGSLIGYAGKLPKQYMQAVFAGTACSGILVSTLRIVTKALLPQNPQGLQTSAHFYFIVSVMILLGCMVCSNLLFILPVMQQHYNDLNHDYDQSPTGNSWPKLCITAKKIQWPAFGIFIIYVVTLSIFPGFIADENQKSNLFQDWYPILLIIVYNCSDLIGKCLTALSVPSNIGKVTWACIARLLFFPAYRLCLHGPKWLKTEVPMVFLTFLLGISNGYLTSSLMILAPKSVSIWEAETAAIVMAVSLGLGLFTGSVLGWLWII